MSAPMSQISFQKSHSGFPSSVLRLLISGFQLVSVSAFSFSFASMSTQEGEPTKLSRNVILHLNSSFCLLRFATLHLALAA